MLHFSFLNTGLLGFLAAAALPIIIWFLAKKKPPKVVFSSLKFIKESQEQQKNRSKITNILLLIIRTLLLLSVILAVARPLLKAPWLKKSGSHPPTAIAVIIDNSYSMDYVEDYQSRLEKAKKAVHTINEEATSGDKLILISRDIGWNLLYSQIFGGDIPDQIIDGIELCWQPVSFKEAISFAENKLKEAMMANNEIYVLTDFIDAESSFESSYPIAFIPIKEKEERQNLSISRASVQPKLVEKSKSQNLQFRLTNHGKKARNEVLVQVVLNDIKVAEKFLNIGARQSIKESIPFELRNEGWQAGYVQVIDDFLLADNRYYFAFEYEEHPPLAVISSSPLPYPLKSVLKLYQGGKEPSVISPNSLNKQLLDKYKLFVFYDFGAINPRYSDFLKELDERGIGSLFCLGQSLSQEQKGFFNQRFGIELKEKSHRTLNIDFVSDKHQSTAIISDKPLRYNAIDGWWQAFGQANTLIGGRGNPLAISKGQSSLWLWDMSADSPFFSDPAFAVYSYLELNNLKSRTYALGLAEVGDLAKAQELKLPSGESIQLAGRKYALNEPGIYTIDPLAQSMALLAVNINYEDSEPDTPALSKKLSILPADFRSSLFLSRIGRDLWKYLLTFALLLVLIELIIVKSQERKSI